MGGREREREKEECPSNVLPGSPLPPLSSSSALPCASPSPPGANKEEAAWGNTGSHGNTGHHDNSYHS